MRLYNFAGFFVDNDLIFDVLKYSNSPRKACCGNSDNIGYLQHASVDIVIYISYRSSQLINSFDRFEKLVYPLGTKLIRLELYKCTSLDRR